MGSSYKEEFDAALTRSVSGKIRMPGVVAMLTDQKKNIYEGCAGERLLGSGAPMTLDTVFHLFSTTKAITGTTALQCVEEGRLDLDAPAKSYVPEIGKLQVLEGFDENGNPKLRPPKRDVTTRMLMLHTAGFGYDFFDAAYARLALEHGQPGVLAATKATLMTPLLFDPGDKWEYGSNMDWCGLVVESIRGERLGDVMKKRVFEPLDMTDIGFTPSPDMVSRLACIHQRGEDKSSLTALDQLRLPAPPEIDMGGHGLHGSVGEYMKFIRMWLNDGMGVNGRVLKSETIEWATKNGLGDKKICLLPGVIPSVALDSEMFPGIPKSWAYTFMVNEEKAPTGRPAGALGWSGLANCYYWIDRKNGIGGYWAAQVFPHADAESVRGFMDFESSAYRLLVEA